MIRLIKIYKIDLTHLQNPSSDIGFAQYPVLDFKLWGYRVGVTRGAGYRVGGTGAHMGCGAGGLFHCLKN